MRLPYATLATAINVQHIRALLNTTSQLFSSIIYADDTTLSTTLACVMNVHPRISISNAINSEKVNVYDWLKVNPLQLFMDNTSIEKDHEFNLLRLMLDCGFSFQTC